MIEETGQDRVYLLHDADEQAIPSQCLAAGGMKYHRMA